MKHIHPYHAPITRKKREQQNNHKSFVIWFTGLSGSGKSTLAHQVEEQLHRMKARTYVLDGDNIRNGLCSDLGFSVKDRAENIRRISEVTKLLVNTGVITLTAFISPFASDRRYAKKLFSSEDFIEVYCRCSLDVCEQRDVKGLYKKARQGKINNFTGISSPYEVPDNPDLIIDTDQCSIENAVRNVLTYLTHNHFIPRT
jgi:adenylylsulfate kinase